MSMISREADGRGASDSHAAMPTLLAINNYYYPRDGSEAVFFGHNQLLEHDGWTVAPFAMQHAQNEASPWAEYFVEEIEFGRPYSVRERLRRIPKVIYSFEARRKLDALLERVRPDVVHSHTVYHHLSPSVLGAVKRRGIPLVMTLHDLKLACPAYHMFNDKGACEACKGGKLHNVVVHRCIKGSAALSALIFAEAVVHRWLKSYENVDRFVVPSRFYADKLVEWGWPRERFVHVPNFVDVEAIEPCYTPGDAFVYFGRLAHEKGLLTLVRAAAAARVPVRLAGAGPLRAALEAEALRLDAQVTFLGRLCGDALLNEIRAARAVVLPSECYENCPISGLEALAAGKPLIGARVGGIPEIVDAGATGWLFDSGSVPALAAALAAAAAAPDAGIAAMGRRARVAAETRYGTRRYLHSMLALYEELGVGVRRSAA